MKVAVALFGEEVSPRFGCSTEVLIASVEAGGVNVEGAQDLTGAPPWQWPEVLSRMGVSTLVCGGIHGRFQQELERRGIQVIWGVIGPAADALHALQNGTLQRDQFVCRGRRRHRAGGRGRWSGDGGVSPGGWPGGGGGGRGRGRGPRADG
jgi:predicted Fe-Mo cluster-binding NifX family protein